MSAFRIAAGLSFGLLAAIQWCYGGYHGILQHDYARGTYNFVLALVALYCAKATLSAPRSPDGGEG